MKILKVKVSKKADARPSMRTKVGPNAFIEIYKDKKGYLYKIDIPGVTSFTSQPFENQTKAMNEGNAHYKRLKSKLGI